MKTSLLTILFLVVPLLAFAAPQNHVSQTFEAERADCDRIKSDSQAKLDNFVAANKLNPADFNLEVTFHPGQAVYNPVDPIGRGPGDQTVNPPQTPPMCDVSLDSKNPSWGFSSDTSGRFKGRNRLHACGAYMSKVEGNVLVVDAYNGGGFFGYCEINVIRAAKN